MNAPSLAVALANLALVLFLVWAGSRAFARSMPLGARGPTRRLVFLALALGWAAGTWSLAKAGVLYAPAANPPRFVLLMGPAVLTVLALSVTPFAARVVETTPLRTLIALQLFRAPVEAILWELAREGFVTERMTFEGSNPEYLTLATLPIAWWAAGRPKLRALVLAWNLLGLATLARIVYLGLRTMPGPWQAFPEPPGNAVLLTTSFIWIPTIHVLTALTLHLLTLRALRSPSPSPN